MATRTLTAANRVEQLSNHVDAKWRSRTPIGQLYTKYKVEAARPLGTHRSTHGITRLPPPHSAPKERIPNIELIAKTTIGPDDSNTKIIRHHVQQLRQIRRVENEVIHGVQRRTYSRPATEKVQRRQTRSERYPRHSTAMDQRDEEAIRREARILSANRQTKSAAKDINKFFNREPPRLLKPQRGQNVEGLGFESDMNFYSISGAGLEIASSIDAFTKDSDNILVTNSKSAVLIAQQTMGGMAGINVGRNGLAVFPSSASGQKASRKGTRTGPNDSNSFAELSDDNIYTDARQVPLSWNEQLNKEDAVVKETCLPPKPREARTPCEQFPVRFKTLAEQDPFIMKLIAESKAELSKDLFRPRSQSRSRPPSNKGNRVVSTGQFVDMRISNSDQMEDEEVEREISEIHKKAKPGNEKCRDAHLVSPAGSHTSDRISPPPEIKNVTNVTVNPTSLVRQDSKNIRSQTADSFMKCRPTALDIHDSHERQKSASSVTTTTKSSARSRRVNSGFRNLQRSKTICHIPTAGTELSTSYVNKKFERIVFPVLYKDMQQKSLAATEDQVINVIINQDEPIDVQSNSMSAFLGANMSAPDRRPKSSSSRVSGTIRQFPDDVVGALGDSQASLVYSALEKTLGASGNDLTQFDAEESQMGPDNTEGSLISLKPRTSSTHSSVNNRNESPQESEQPTYSTGIHVQIASKPAVTNPPPAPTPEPEIHVYPTPQKTPKKVRIASPRK